MYLPQAFREDDLSTLQAFMQQYSFATLITQHDGMPYASHLPLLFRAQAGPYGTLLGHMARANPQWHDFTTGREVLAIFHGPHVYVSPSWYGVHPSVPTWNYAVVHAYGIPQLIADNAVLYEVLQELVRTFEAPSPTPWAFELPGEYVQSMMRGIVGFTLRLTRLEGKYKLSQNRAPADQRRVTAALQTQGDALSSAVATLMAQRAETTP
jgi:transcriptional regulator